MSNLKIKECGLCRNDAPLELSHIVPSFVGKHLKKTSATGYLRSPEAPNMRVQDLEKVRMLCRNCEQLFSDLERAFANKYFEMLQSDQFRELRYDEDLYRFAISLGWRVLAVSAEEFLADHPRHTTLVESTLESWRLFLLSKRKSNNSVVHLFVFAGIPVEVSSDMPPKALHYMLRAIDTTIYHGRAAFGVYVKLLRSVFFLPLMPRDLKGMKNTRIDIRGGRIIGPQKIENGRLGGFLSSRVKEAFSVGLSPTQLEKIKASMLKDPARALSSESYIVAKASSRFGLE